MRRKGDAEKVAAGFGADPCHGRKAPAKQGSSVHDEGRLLSGAEDFGRRFDLPLIDGVERKGGYRGRHALIFRPEVVAGDDQACHQAVAAGGDAVGGVGRD